MTKQKPLAHRYLERDISWMYFNQRLLLEASKKELPLIERLNFLGIYSNNLDEFFRVRVATLNRILEDENPQLQQRKVLVAQTLRQINKLNKQYSREFEDLFRQIVEDLSQENMFIVNEKQLNADQKAYIRKLYTSKLCGSINPVFLSSLKRLDNESDSEMYLAIKLGYSTPLVSHKKDYAIIQLPTREFGRFVILPEQDGKNYIIFIDDVIRVCLPLIFNGLGYATYEAFAFKFTKDAEMEFDNDMRIGTLQRVYKGVKSRKGGEAIRFVYDELMPSYLLSRIGKKLLLDKMDTRVLGGRYHNMKDLMKFPDCGKKYLRYKPMPPISQAELNSGSSIIKMIREKDFLLHFPYHSFDSYVSLLREAALSKEVKTIKTTLYRLASDSDVVKSLICAAKNGKKVVVVIELLARFDEESNIKWSKKMQEAGVKVIFGVEGLKIHSKVTYIGTKGNDIACVSTGNFHEGTAKVYTDYMLLTAEPKITAEVKKVFDFIEKPYKPVNFKELLVSPNEMKRKFISMINREIKNHTEGHPSGIMMKINHITDPVMVNKLYEAAEAGVKVQIMLRGNSSLVLSHKKLKENLKVTALIDRYLEHSRIVMFTAGGEEQFYIGSADWMPRNLDNRIEVYAPIHDPAIKHDLKTVLEYGMMDTSQGFVVDGGSENKRWESNGELFQSQVELYKYYKEKNEELCENIKVQKSASLII